MPSRVYTGGVARLAPGISLAVQPGLVGSRMLPSVATQLRTEYRTQELCAITNVEALAKASGNVQNNHVSTIVGLTLALQGDASFSGPPRVGKTGARYQNLMGSRDNPAAHVLPCNITLNDKHMKSYVRPGKARDRIAEIFGSVFLGCQQRWDDPVMAAILNEADGEVEDFDADTGSVAAFVEAVRAAVKNCDWSGKGRSPLSEAQLAETLEQIDKSVWKPKAAQAYEFAWNRTQGKRNVVHDEAQRERLDAVAEVISAKADAVKLLPIQYGFVAKQVVGIVSQE